MNKNYEGTFYLLFSLPTKSLIPRCEVFENPACEFTVDIHEAWKYSSFDFCGFSGCP